MFSGDFHQLRAVGCNSNGLLYEGVMNGLFEGSINTAIILEDSNCFDKDLWFGELLKRLWLCKMTEEDIELMTTRVVGTNGLSLPEDTTDADTCYACPMNKERNAIPASIFKNIFVVGLFLLWIVLRCRQIIQSSLRLIYKAVTQTTIWGKQE